MDKYYITLGKLSCVCGSVRISNFQNHITKIVTFSASLLLSIRWYLFKDGFSKAHQLNYTVQGGNVSFVSDVAWLHNRHYPVVWMYSLTCIQPGGGDDHADQRKALRTQSICSRSMVCLTSLLLSSPFFECWTFYKKAVDTILKFFGMILEVYHHVIQHHHWQFP